MKIAYITGCLGFIGLHFTRKCLENNWKVIGVDKLTYAANVNVLHEFEKNKNFKFLNKDICDLDYLYDCDFVINFAAESHVDNSISDSKSFIKSNVFGVQNLLELIRSKHSNCSDAPIFVQISTDEVYGDIESGMHTERDLLKPSNPYSASKAAADMLVFAWSRTYGVKYQMFRPTNNYGFYQYPEKLIPISVKNLNRNNKIKLHNNGDPVRTWLHVEDTANGIFHGITNGSLNEIYNISGGFEQKNIDTVKKIINAYDSSYKWEDYVDSSYARLGQDVRYSIDDTKLRSLGWKPDKTFDEEISKIVLHFKSNFRW